MDIDHIFYSSNKYFPFLSNLSLQISPVITRLCRVYLARIGTF